MTKHTKLKSSMSTMLSNPVDHERWLTVQFGHFNVNEYNNSGAKHVHGRKQTCTACKKMLKKKKKSNVEWVLLPRTDGQTRFAAKANLGFCTEEKQKVFSWTNSKLRHNCVFAYRHTYCRYQGTFANPSFSVPAQSSEISNSTSVHKKKPTK